MTITILSYLDTGALEVIYCNYCPILLDTIVIWVTNCNYLLILLSYRIVLHCKALSCIVCS